MTRTLAITIAIALAACKHEPPAPAPDRWAKVTELAADLVPAGPSDQLAVALAATASGDVPEAAIDQLVAWAEANGGLPWRADHTIGGEQGDRTMSANRLAEEALRRRPTEVRVAHAVLYLGQRLRSEGSCLIDSAVGSKLALLVRTTTKFPVADLGAQTLVPTPAEVRRALALIAECDRDAVVRSTTTPDHKSDERLRSQARSALEDLVVDAPADYHALGDHADAVVRRHDTELIHILLSERDGRLLRELAAEVDASRAWAGVR